MDRQVLGAALVLSGVALIGVLEFVIVWWHL